MQYETIVDFKADFHKLQIRTKKDAMSLWHKFPYLMAKEDIVRVVSKQPSDWITGSDVGVGTGKATKESTAQMTTIENKKESQKASTQEKAAQKKEFVAREKEVIAKDKEAKETMILRVTIDVEESKMEKTPEEEEIEEEDEGGSELESPFVIKKRKKQTSTRLRQKQQFDRSVGMTPLVLTKGDLDEIRYVVRDITTNI